jgi:hypothetical protein
MKPITLLEKLALLSIGAAAAFKALLWSLNQTADSSDWYIVRLRVIFAALSFVAFDLVIGAVVLRGWSKSGAIALLVAAAVSAALALAVAGVWTEPALHAAPALTLAAFGLHLMWIRREAGAGAADTSAPAEPNAAPVAQATAAVQVNVAPASAAAAHDRCLHRSPRGGAAAVLASADRGRAGHQCRYDPACDGAR